MCAQPKRGNGTREVALRESEERYRCIFAAVNDGILIIDPSERYIVDTNQKAAEILRYSQKELSGMPIEKIHPKEMQQLKGIFKEVLLGKPVQSDEFSCLRKDNHRLPAEISFSLVQLNGKDHLMAMVRDISERKGAEQALKENEERFRTLYNHTPVMMHSIDPEGKLASVNDYWLETLGYELNEVIGKKVFKFYTKESAQYANEVAFKRFKKKGFIKDEEIQVVKKGGEVVDVLLSAVGEWNEKGELLHSLAFLVDVTERTRAEQALEEKSSQLQAITEAMMGFLEKGNLQQASTLLLHSAMKQTESEYGFVAVIVDGPVLRILTHEGFVWHDTLNREYYENAMRGLHEVGYMDFGTLDNLFGRVVTDKQVVLTNSPETDPRRSGLPPGHPPLRNFLGVPAIKGSEVVGVIGLANRPEGYTEAEQVKIEILTQALAVLFDSYLRMQREATLEAERKRAQEDLKKARDELEIRVKERTSELSKAIKRLKKQIAERKRAEAALQESEARYRSLYTKTPVMLHSIDATGKLISVSDYWLQNLGYELSEVIGRRIPEFLTQASRQDAENIFLREFFKTGFLKEKELQFVKKNGEIIDVLLSAIAERDANGEIVRSMAVLVDVTERKQAKEALQKAHDELEIRVQERTAELSQVNELLANKNEELESFAYSVSHDLQAPLRSIDGFSKALLEDCADSLNDSGKDFLNRVRAASQRMGHLIDDMLHLSRVSRTEMIPTKKIDLSAMAKTITQELHEEQSERQVTFVIMPEIEVSGDVHLLRIALENLLDNAWKYTSKHPRAKIEFGVTEHEGKKAYFVRDDGAGFDTKFVGKLFGPFQRLHRSNEFEGNGIGLATVQRIIHRHGGRVWAEGAVEKGATFFFTLP